MSAAAGDNVVLLSKGYRAWLLTVLTLVCTFNFADRAILNVLAEPIKQDLRLSDTQIGVMGGIAFAALYSILGVPLGRLAERKSRINIISICVLIWSAMTTLCAFAGNFWHLLLCRIGVGVGEAGFFSPTNSLLGDHYPREKRASALSIVMLGTPLGFMSGAIIGGLIVQHFDWRAAFLAFGVPGIIAALLMRFTLKEPPRGLAEGHPPSTDAPPSLGAVLKHLWAKPTFRQLLIGASVVGFSLNAIGSFTNPYLIRVQGLNFAQAGLIFGLISGFANGAGTLLGGFGSDKLAKRDVRWWCWVPVIALTAVAPVYVLAFTAGDIYTAAPLIFVGNTLLIIFYTPTFAMLHNMVGPRMRATTIALFSMVFGLVGAGLGPTGLGMISDLIGGMAFTGGDYAALCPGGRAPAGADPALAEACRAASSDGLRYAMVAVQVFFLWGAVHYWLASRTLKQDLVPAPAHAA